MEPFKEEGFNLQRSSFEDDESMYCMVNHGFKDKEEAKWHMLDFPEEHDDLSRFFTLAEKEMLNPQRWESFNRGFIHVVGAI